MAELLTAAQMKAIETAAIDSGAVTGLELMERAGRGVVEAVFEHWPDLAAAPHRAVVCCGPGNNGGDGFVVARLLKQWGWEVDLFLTGDPGKLPPDAKANCARWQEIGEVGAPEAAEAVAPRCDLAIDALFGTGLTRPVAADLGRPLRCVPVGARVVAVDIPSGLDADSGRVLGAAAPADLTVAFHRAKLGHHLGDGPATCGRLAVKEIGLAEPCPEAVSLTGPPSWGALAKGGVHKYSHGHALILSGGPGATGAARLAARGALRIGAGLVTLGVPPAAQSEVAAQVTAVMLQRIADGDALRGVLEDDRINALALGPGLGLNDEKAALVEAALESGRATVLDADALTLIGRDAALFALLHENCVLTPHGGEFGRLFPDLAEKLRETPESGPAFSKVDATCEAAKRAGCVVLHKGPDTVIARPDGRCGLNSAQYERAAPWLATAGAGDVLTGLVAGLLARGMAPMEAAESAAWLHVECARRFGPGLIAEDLPEELPGLLRALDR